MGYVLQKYWMISYLLQSQPLSIKGLITFGSLQNKYVIMWNKIYLIFLFQICLMISYKNLVHGHKANSTLFIHFIPKIDHLNALICSDALFTYDQDFLYAMIYAAPIAPYNQQQTNQST